VEAIHILGVKVVGAADCLRQSVAVGRRNDKVDVVGHQAVRHDADAVLRSLLAEERDIGPAVVVGEEHVLAVVTPLRDVVLVAADHDPCNAWHEYKRSTANAGCQTQFRRDRRLNRHQELEGISGLARAPCGRMRKNMVTVPSKKCRPALGLFIRGRVV